MKKNRKSPETISFRQYFLFLYVATGLLYIFLIYSYAALNNLSTVAEYSVRCLVVSKISGFSKFSGRRSLHSRCWMRRRRACTSSAVALATRNVATMAIFTRGKQDNSYNDNLKSRLFSSLLLFWYILFNIMRLTGRLTAET